MMANDMLYVIIANMMGANNESAVLISIFFIVVFMPFIISLYDHQV